MPQDAVAFCKATCRVAPTQTLRQQRPTTAFKIQMHALVALWSPWPSRVRGPEAEGKLRKAEMVPPPRSLLGGFANAHSHSQLLLTTAAAALEAIRDRCQGRDFRAATGDALRGAPCRSRPSGRSLAESYLHCNRKCQHRRFIITTTGMVLLLLVQAISASAV